MNDRIGDIQTQPEREEGRSAQETTPPPAGPGTDDYPSLFVAAFLDEIRDGLESFIRRLSAVGFDDMQGDELLALMTLGKPIRGMRGWLRRTGISDQSVEATTETLISRGYLSRSPNPARAGQLSIAFAERGVAASNEVFDELAVQRWAAFPFRQGDIVISTPPKSGTTWLQMICALLIFQTPDLPAPVRELSPWLDDWRSVRGALFTQLAAQPHRRFIKTHVSPGRIDIDPRATYITVARDPLDALLSMHRQSDLSLPEARRASLPSLRERLLKNLDPAEPYWSRHLVGHMQILSGGWARREEPNFMLLHYQDLRADLEGQMRGIATQLGITVPETVWPGLVKAATFDQMRAAADRIQPLSGLENPAEFFWKGKSGSGRALLTDAELDRYHERVAQLAPPELLTWLHR